MKNEPLESWTRAGRTAYYKSRRRRGLLALLGVALILLSVGTVLVQVLSAGLGAAAPEDETLRLTVPKMRRADNVPVYDAPASDEEALRNGALHVRGTGFPWEAEANVYIAGHRLGYPRTKSLLVFWDLNKLKRGDGVMLRDSEGRTYVYEVFDRFVVGPNEVSVKEPIAGKNIVSLQTCTLPDYAQRLIVQAELVRTVDAPAQAGATDPWHAPDSRVLQTAFDSS